MSFIRSLTARSREDDGFTLIELMVVVLIIAILIAIAIPTFLGARQRAQDRAAQSDLRNGLTAEKTFYTDNQSYSTDTSTAGLMGIESSLKWGTTLKVYVGDVTTGDGNVVCLEEKSKSGTVFAIGDIASGTSAGTYYGKAGCGGAATVASVSGLGSNW